MQYLFYVFMLLLSTHLFGDETPSPGSLFENYKLVHPRTISEISDDVAKGVFFLLLNDGTLWEVYYDTLNEHQKVMQNWKPGLNVTTFPQSLHSKVDGYGFMVYGTNLVLPTLLELSTADNLPTIANIDKGTIMLSDGSTWQENSFLYYASKYWNAEERVVVNYNTNDACLINVDQPPTMFLDHHYLNANFLSWVEP